MNETAEAYRNELGKRYQTAAFLVFGLMISALILFGLVWLIPVRPENSLDPQTRMTLWVSALFLALGTFILRRMLYRWERLKDISVLKGIPGVLKTLQITAVLLAVMAFFVTVIGFVITFLNGDNFEMIRALIISLVVFIINFPRRAVWKKIAANLENV